ncbi:MAG TPA: ABC transporter permease [Vicinamibacterales bacterium]|nr:ABC transporter permease [Vicinamibacterales bacterium]
MPGLILRGLTYYWRTHLAVVGGVATAVAVLAGALLVGDSVRGSLRDLVLGRLGNTDVILTSSGFFREQLGADIQAQPELTEVSTGAAPLVVLRGMVTGQESGRRAGQVRVYGVDDRFWRFHGVQGVTGPVNRDAFISPALAEQIGAVDGTAILVRVQRPTEIPLESLHGRRDDVGRTMRLTVRRVLPSSLLGDFSLEAQQGEVRAVFVPLSRLQQDLETPQRVNTWLVSAGDAAADGGAGQLGARVRRYAQVEDLGLNVKPLDARHALEVSADAGVLDDALVAAVLGTDTQAQPMFTYLANSMRVGDREVPYSLVTAMNDPDAPNGRADAIVLNEWAAKELNARVGDPLTMDYYLFEEPGQLVTRIATFTVSAVVPIEAGDRDMAPAYPGITDSPTLGSWNPPFPVDLRRIRPIDEQYWEQYRTTPKAFVTLEAGQRLWRSRYGAVTSIRIPVSEDRSLDEARRSFTERLRAAVDPLAFGLSVRNVRGESLDASRGATDFGEYFVYFSFFLVVSALLLAALFFKLGVEQRAREVGLLRAVGFGPAQVRRFFLGEALVLSVAGSAIGVIAALGYAWAIMFGLRSWWVDAVGTTQLALHVSITSLAIGALSGVVAAIVCIWWTLRSLSRISERSLLAGQLDASPDGSPGLKTRPYVVPSRRLQLVASALVGIGAALVAAGAAGWAAPAGAFFGAGTALLGASLCLFSLIFRRRGRSALDGHGWQPVSRLGFRNATYRPGRSVLSIAVIASATFILISVDAFRRGEGLEDAGEQSGVGGYSVFVETLVPIVQDANSRTGRDALGLSDLDASVSFEPFRLLPGDDASCLNLYEPKNPRILAPTDAFLTRGRFAFQGSLASTDAERADPWMLLRREEEDGAIPVIADANSMTYVLHRQLGEEIVISRGGRDVRLRFVAALRDSIFQGELLMSQANFIRLFPDQEGYRVMLVQTPPGQSAAVTARLEDVLADLGADAIGTAQRLAQFHRVENTYLSTFQTLGGLGLLLGTIGLATVLLRNVLERRRELALLGAIGFRPGHVLTMVVAENALLLGGGLVTGAICAGIAIAPAVIERGGRLPLTSGGALLLFGVFVTGLLSSVVALRAATRAPLLASLQSE